MSKMDDYIEEGNKWEEVGLYELKKDKKVYRISTILLSIGMTISILVACWALFTKEVLIEILEVDRESDRRSLLTVIKAGETLEIEQQEALLMGDIRRYIDCYEGYSHSSKNTNAECVASRSISEVYRGYEAYTKNGAEEVLGVTGMVKVKIDNINTLTADNNIVVAHVSLYPQKSGTNISDPIIVTINIVYKYENVPTDKNERQLNPLGFVVLSYTQSFKH